MFFDTENEKPAEQRSGFEPVPAGWHRVLIESAETKATKKGDGKFIKMVLTGLDGAAKNRKFFHNFNIQNPSAKAQQIGRGEFKNLLSSIGVTKSLVSEEEMKATVTNKVTHALLGIRSRDDGSKENSVKDFSSTPKDKASAAKKASKPEDTVPF